MKNKNGFISMTLVYTFLILFLFLMLSILNSYSRKNSYLDTIDEKIKKEINLSSGILNTSSLVFWYNSCEEGSTKIQCKIISAEDTAGTDESINFGINSASSGLYYTSNPNITDKEMRVYFYRGNVTNNNVIFKGKCWKVIRTNENGDVKLIYSGVPTSNTCPNQIDTTLLSTTKFNNNSSDNAHVGFIYGTSVSPSYELTHINTNRSQVLNTLYSWYETQLSGEGSGPIVDALYCNDRTISESNTGFSTNRTYYGPRSRIYNTNVIPVLKCKTLSNDFYYGDLDGTANNSFTLKDSNGGTYTGGNKALDYPIGLLTVDEAVYAGANTTTNTYLNTSNIYWTMSPYSFEEGTAKVYVVNNGNVEGTSVTNDYYFIPVITISGSTAVTGNGSSATPYTVS